MRVFPRGKWLFLIFLVLILGILYGQHPRILRGLGHFLVKEDPPHRADLIICLSGSLVDRTLAAADLYRAGWADRIFIFRGQSPDGYERLAERGIQLPETRELAYQILIRSGIPKSSVLSDKRESSSTYDEACLMRDFLRTHHLSSLILVTSKYHSKRAYLTFRSVLTDSQFQIWNCPSPYDGFNPETWWKQEKWTKAVLSEYQKGLASLIQGRIRPSVLLKGG